jgi:hypothetical protein
MVEHPNVRAKIFDVGGVDLFIQLLSWPEHTIQSNILNILDTLCQHGTPSAPFLC